jgi:hypothetical protein
LLEMGDIEDDRQKAMAAVRAMFERYKLIAAQRPDDHIVSNYSQPIGVFANLMRCRTLIAKSWRA